VTIEIRLLAQGDAAVLDRVAPDVFDNPIDRGLTAEFLADPRHHLAVALENGTVVGFASGVHYIHPDKPAELWVNELGVASTHRGQGIGKAVLAALLEVGRALGCVEAWVLTDQENSAAMAVYRALGGVEAPTLSTMLNFPLTPRS
jgi:ribosomal protein S18 acetylase RimI-like enzyme